ncbi:myb-like protein X isoform X2 [Asterias rubens]|uniref:myb-like protein X isoform X2 n=1 Tax=Asterias rubens TaxID=7604 RepID=UPI00145525DF|nr:myb-like protein X isoform X2 [Asterias rubens]
MTAVYDNDSFFDSDGEQDNHKVSSPYLKGAYDRGKSPVDEDPVSKHTPRIKSLTPSTSGNFSAKSSDSIMSNKKSVRSRRYDDSPSLSRSRSRSPYRSPYRSPDYSDSFNSEDSDQDSRKGSPVRKEPSRKGRVRSVQRSNGDTTTRFNSSTSHDSRSTFRSHGGSSNYGAKNNRNKKAFQKTPIKKPAAANNTKRSNSIASSQASPRNTEVQKRMLSAKGHTISRLRNEFNQLQQEHDETMRENKLLKQLQRRQERALSKYDAEESELPQMLKKHSAELDSMRRRIRKYQERDKDRDRRIKDKDEQLNQTQDELKHIKGVAEDKGLLERHELQRRVERMEEKVEKRDKTVRDLERYVANIKKNQRHELHERQTKEQELMGQIERLEMENERYQLQLREKEKELEVRNIYSNRLIKPPTKLKQGVSPTNFKPLMVSKATSTAEQPKVPRPPPEKQQRALSAEEAKRREEKASRVKSPKDAGKEVKTEDEKKEHGTDLKQKDEELSEHEKILRDLDMGFERKKETNDNAEAERRRMEERRERQEREERERRKKEEEENEFEAMRRREEAERQKRRDEDEAAKRKQEEEAKEKERKKNEEERARKLDYSSDEDDDKVPFFGDKKPAAAAKPASSSPAFAVNSVRDLHKYSRGDGSNSGKDEAGRNQRTDSSDKQKEEDRLAEERRKKDLLLARMKDIDEGAKPDSGRSRKNYNFTRPVENLHNGMPSHPDGALANGNQGKKADNATTFGGYAPTFTAPKAQPKPPKKSFFDDDDDDSGDLFSKPKPAGTKNDTNKKADLMADLFGNNADEEKAAKSSFNDDKNMFTSSTKAKPVSYPWEKKVDVGRGSNPSGGLFASSPTNKAAGNSKAPGNMSHDSLDDIDDIEEVIL